MKLKSQSSSSSSLSSSFDAAAALGSATTTTTTTTLTPTRTRAIMLYLMLLTLTTSTGTLPTTNALTPPFFSSSNHPRGFSFFYADIHLHSDDKEKSGSTSTSSTTTSKTDLATNPFQVLTVIRGGGEGNNKKKKRHSNAVSSRIHSSLSTTMTYWSDAFGMVASTVTKPIRTILDGGNFLKQKPTFLQSKVEREQNQLLQQLHTVQIQHVTVVPPSSVLPNDIVQLAAQRAGLLGRPLQQAPSSSTAGNNSYNNMAIQELARYIKQWYDRNGYILHAMTGATLKVDTQTAELTLQEPVSSSPSPVKLIYCKEMVIDPDDGSLLTFRQYRDKYQERSSSSSSTPTSSNRKLRGSSYRLDRSKLNTTFVPTDTGRTSAKRIATALGLEPGAPFCWNAASWRTIVERSGVFRRVLRATPQRLPDGSVQLQVLVQEAPARNLEYGITKSLYTDSWEGEIDFMHRNLLGGGETLGITVKRGTHDAEPSVRVRFRNDNFGLGSFGGRVGGGYDVEAFSDYIGEHLEDSVTSSPSPGTPLPTMMGQESGGGSSSDSNDENNNTNYYGQDELLDRKGASISFRNPLWLMPWEKNGGIANTATACLERTSTKGGRHESVGTATFTLGPVSRELPLQARTSVFGKFMTGARLTYHESSTTTTGPSTTYSTSLLPFASLSATTRQIFPLAIISSSARKTNNSNAAGRPVVLALSNTATTSTRHLPRHELNAQGIASKIRGFTNAGGGIGSGTKTSERVSTYLVSTTELRIPIAMIPRVDDLSLVLFGDLSVSQSSLNDPFRRKSSIGIGLRTPFQGLPLKFEVTYAKGQAKIGTSFGIGPDFVA